MPIVLPTLINGVSLKALAESPLLRTAIRHAGSDRVLVLIQLNMLTVILGVASLVLVGVYPLMKRFVSWPQLVLG